MARLLTNHICGMTELRGSHKVLERPDDKLMELLRRRPEIKRPVLDPLKDKSWHWSF